MKIYKITEASDYLGVSINTLKTLANKDKTKFKCTKCGYEIHADLNGAINIARSTNYVLEAVDTILE